MEDKMIEIAQFQMAIEAEILASLIKSEGIECYVRDGISNLGALNTNVDILLKDASRAIEIMKDHNYEIPKSLYEKIDSKDSDFDNTEDDNTFADRKTENEYNDSEFFEDENEYDTAALEKKKTKLARQMTIFCILMVMFLLALYFLNKYFNG